MRLSAQAIFLAGALASIALFLALSWGRGDFASPVSVAQAQDSPSIAIELSPSSPVEPGTEITVTMSFGGLEEDSYNITIDYVFRADVLDSDSAANACEDRADGYGLGVDRYMRLVDEDPEVRTGIISADCPAGDYTLEVSIDSVDGATRLLVGSASLDFSIIAAPAAVPESQSSDARLSGLTIDGTTLNNFAAGKTAYTKGVANAVSQVTVAAVTADGNASAVINPADADSGAAGHQVALSEGRNVIAVTVTAEDGNTTKTYTVVVGRGVDTPYGWKATDDFEAPIHRDFNEQGDIWSDGDTMYILEYQDRFIWAYSMADKTYNDEAKELNIKPHQPSYYSRGIWSDGDTMWVAEQAPFNRIAAYNLAPGTNRVAVPDLGKVLALPQADGLTVNPAGIWSDGETMWVAEYHPTLRTTRKIFAIDMATDDRAEDREITVDPDNTAAWGIWSNGCTMWVADEVDRKIYAYNLVTKNRDSSKDFDTLSAAGISRPRGIWSDGVTMWVMNDDSGNNYDKIYSFNMPPRSGDVTLASLAVNGVRIPFDPGVTGYHVGVDNSVTAATITAEATHDCAAVTGEDSAPITGDSGYERSPLFEGVSTTTTITVTAEDSSTKDYTITVGRGVTEDKVFGWKSTDDFNDLWSDGETMWVADPSDDKIYAYNVITKSRDLGKDFSLSSGNRMARGLWSDGETMWVSDNSALKIYAYNMETKGRDGGKDINLVSANTETYGLWSDGRTMWVANRPSLPLKLFSYDMETRQPTDPSLDYLTAVMTLAGNTSPHGIWSDGSTMWVADSGKNKIYSYHSPTQYVRVTRTEGNDETAREGATLSFDVTRTGLSGGWLTVAPTRSVTGDPFPSGFTWPNPNLVFSPDERTKTITVRTENDRDYELDGSVTLGVREWRDDNPANVYHIHPTQSSATYKVADDERFPPIEVRVDQCFTVFENEGPSFRMPVHARVVPSGAPRFNYTTALSSRRPCRGWNVSA